MFGGKQKSEESPPLMEQEGRFVAHLNKVSYAYLGRRFEWFNKIRTAKKGGLALFQGKDLEQQMEATRSALNFVLRQLNGSLMLAFNGTVDQVKNSGTAPEGWPEKIQTEDRNNPPMLSTEQDAIMIAWAPLQFLNVTKPVRDRGKGVEFYTDGLIKKIFFKVVGYYSDPEHWSQERLAYFLNGLEKDTGLAEVNAKLARFKADVESFANGFVAFRFGRVSRNPEQPTNKNALDDSLRLSDDEMVPDLFFQSLLLHGLHNFFFRYYLTLVTATENPRAIAALGGIFRPLFAKCEELRVQFQASFTMDRDKMRLREAYQAYLKQMESQPLTETLTEKGREVQKINYSHKLSDAASFPRGPVILDAQMEPWQDLLRTQVLPDEKEQRYVLLMEVLNTLVWNVKHTVDAKLKVTETLRAFAEDQRKLSLGQLAKKRRDHAEAKRAKSKQLARFKALEQFNMVPIVQKEIEELDAKNKKELESLEEAINKRAENLVLRVRKMAATARDESRNSMGRAAGRVYEQLVALDPEGKVRTGFTPFLMEQLAELKDDGYHPLFRNLFQVVTTLSPAEKMTVRKAVGEKMELEETDLVVSEEDMAHFNAQVSQFKQALEKEIPGLMEQKFIHGSFQARIADLLTMNLNPPSFQVLLQMPMQPPHKAPAKLPGSMARKLVQLNRLINPTGAVDLLLPNVAEDQSPERRINFNRLSKLVTNQQAASA